MNLGRCLLLPDCPVGITSGHMLETHFKVDYVPNEKLVVHVTSDLKLEFIKAKYETMQQCNLHDMVLKLRCSKNVFNTTIDERLNSYTKNERLGIVRAVELQKALK